MLGFNVWHGEEMLATNFQVQVVETGNVLTWTVQTWAVEETVIYTREDTEKELAGKLNSLIGNYSISYAVVHECSMQTNDYKLCIKNVMWVANAESSMFKKWMKPSNNGFGRMYKWKKRKFSSVENSIKQCTSEMAERKEPLDKTGSGGNIVLAHVVTGLNSILQPLGK